MRPDLFRTFRWKDTLDCGAPRISYNSVTQRGRWDSNSRMYKRVMSDAAKNHCATCAISAGSECGKCGNPGRQRGNFLATSSNPRRVMPPCYRDISTIMDMSWSPTCRARAPKQPHKCRRGKPFRPHGGVKAELLQFCFI